MLWGQPVHPMTDIVIVGAGSLGREVLCIFSDDNQEKKKWNVLGYLDDDPAKRGSVAETPVLGPIEWLRQPNRSSVRVLCAVGDPSARQRIVGTLRAIGAQFCSALHPSVVRSRWVQLGEDVILMAGTVLTSQIRVGSHVVVNPACTISHNCTLADFCYLSPGCHLSGYVELEEGAMLGTGVNIIPGKKVGAWSVIGAGAVVITDIPAHTTAAGVPCRILKAHASGAETR